MQIKWKKIPAFMLSAVLCISLLTTVYAEEAEEDIILEEQSDNQSSAPEIEGLAYLSETPLQYAECFHIYNYEDGYAVIDIPQSGTYLIVPEGAEIPEGTEDMVILKQPLNRIYLAATSAMALFQAIDAVGNIRLSGTNASGWYIESAVEALESGEMIYAGKYSEPDYETLISEDCNLAIESTMIYHTPKVKEMIEDLDIPVLVDRSSYESHPLGKTEWVKMYAVLVGKQAEAESFFEEQTAVIEELKDFENTEKTIAFFFVNTDGSVVIRNPKDYIPKMIEIAGGRYAFADIDATDKSTSFSITMEEFYTIANNADYIIYNGSINGPISSIEELIAKDDLFADMKAVQEGNVWTIDRDFYQATDRCGQLIKDINRMLIGEESSDMTFLIKVD